MPLAIFRPISCDGVPSSRLPVCSCCICCLRICTCCSSSESSPLQKLESGLAASSNTDDLTASRMESGRGRSGKGEEARARTCEPPGHRILPAAASLITAELRRPACLAAAVADDRENAAADGNIGTYVCIYYVDIYVASKKGNAPSLVDMQPAAGCFRRDIAWPMRPVSMSRRWPLGLFWFGFVVRLATSQK